MNIFVTGASGFIGTALCSHLLSKGWIVHGSVSSLERSKHLVFGVDPVTTGSIGPETDYGNQLNGIDTVIHLAARVHVMNDSSKDPLAEFRIINVAGTINLALQAVKAGVRRFVFVSSIKVNGEGTSYPYTEESDPQPLDPYGTSKLEAEIALRKIESETGLEVVIVRPTLVYGPGVKANFLFMMKIVNRRLPLPFALINNKRSLIYVGNLADALATCAYHPEAAGKTYLVSDGDDVSTPELLRRTAASLGVPIKLWPLSPTYMKFVGSLIGKSGAINRILGNLTVNSSKIVKELEWTPPSTMKQGLADTAAWFLATTATKQSNITTLQS